MLVCVGGCWPVSSAFRHLSRTVLILAGRGVCIILVTKESETEKRSFFALFKFIRSCRQFFLSSVFFVTLPFLWFKYSLELIVRCNVAQIWLRVIKHKGSVKINAKFSANSHLKTSFCLTDNFTLMKLSWIDVLNPDSVFGSSSSCWWKL